MWSTRIGRKEPKRPLRLPCVCCDMLFGSDLLSSRVLSGGLSNPRNIADQLSLWCPRMSHWTCWKHVLWALTTEAWSRHIQLCRWPVLLSLTGRSSPWVLVSHSSKHAVATCRNVDFSRNHYLCPVLFSSLTNQKGSSILVPRGLS